MQMIPDLFCDQHLLELFTANFYLCFFRTGTGNRRRQYCFHGIQNWM